MPHQDPPARGALDIETPSTDRGERRPVLLWRALAGTLALAAYAAVGLAGAVLALAPIAGRRPAGRRALAAEGSAAGAPLGPTAEPEPAAAEDAMPEEQALPV